MVRSYARLLRIDAAPLLETLADRLAVPDADRLAARYGEPVPFSDGARRSTFVYVALSVAVLAVAALVGAKEHAVRQAEAGVDIVTAAGGEAGGHCGEVATLVLVPEVVEALKPYGNVPVLAAGGIVTGRQMAACMATGPESVRPSTWARTISAAMRE